MSDHAVLSASGSHRWLMCPPSAKLEQSFPDKGSAYAAEGSYAHAMAEHILTRYLSGAPDEALADFDKTSEFYSEEMAEYVRGYTDFCIERVHEAEAKDAGAAAMVEERLDFGRWAPDGFGTGDMVILADGMLEVIDLKYGKGVAVSAEGNSQMRLYALGAVDAYGEIFDIDAVRMTIFQPRLGNVSEQVMALPELLAWGETVKPIAAQAMAGEGEMKAGPHCRFCRAAAVCRTLSAYQLELAKLEFREPPLLSDEEVAEVLRRVQELKTYAELVSGYALNEAVAGRKSWPGFKLVEGRGRRVIADQEAAARALTAAGYRAGDIYRPIELQTLTALEKLAGKKRLAETLGALLQKESGKPALAPIEDKRPAYVPNAVSEFEIEEER